MMYVPGGKLSSGQPHRPRTVSHYHLYHLLSVQQIETSQRYWMEPFTPELEGFYALYVSRRRKEAEEANNPIHDIIDEESVRRVKVYRAQRMVSF